jgi:hypothetical protein
MLSRAKGRAGRRSCAGTAIEASGQKVCWADSGVDDREDGRAKWVGPFVIDRGMLVVEGREKGVRGRRA